MLNKEYTGLVIKNNIDKLGITYEALAEKVNLTTSRVIYDWIDGFKLPSIERLVLLSDLFGIKVDDMLK